MPTFHNHDAADSQAYNLLDDPTRMLSDHFALAEFASRDGTLAVLVHPALVELLEAIRAEVGRPVVITSGYRSAAHNRRVGGRSQSRHLWGMAADIIAPGIATDRIRRIADDLEAGGVGHYPGRFVHVDVEGEGRRWTG